jgi:uncharacterized paraquat-inducible protein A
MTPDPIDATPTQQKREAKYKKCSHCKQYSQTEGKCPACGGTGIQETTENLK